MGIVVTIDGPAASGKTSVSRELAKRLAWDWVSTGSFYRGLALVAMELGTNLDSEDELSQLAESNVWKVEMGELRTRVYFKDQDVTDKIGQESVGSIASKISHYPKVRASLLQGQRDCERRTEGLVAEGRDCGTVVFPQARAKIYLTAKQENRAERRARELGLAAEELVQEQTVRDQQDSSRKTAPLQVPPNALVVDTTEMSFEEVVDTVEDYVRKTLGQISK